MRRGRSDKRPKTMHMLKDVPREQTGVRVVRKGVPDSRGRNTLNSLKSSCGGFFHEGVIAKFNEGRLNGTYGDGGFKGTPTKSVVQVECEMWTGCRQLFSAHRHMYVDESLWGKRENSHKKYDGVQTHPDSFYKKVGKVFKELAIFLIVGQVTSNDSLKRVLHTNVLIVHWKDAERSCKYRNI